MHDKKIFQNTCQLLRILNVFWIKFLQSSNRFKAIFRKMSEYCEIEIVSTCALFIAFRGLQLYKFISVIFVFAIWTF